MVVVEIGNVVGTFHPYQCEEMSPLSTPIFQFHRPLCRPYTGVQPDRSSGLERSDRT